MTMRRGILLGLLLPLLLGTGFSIAVIALQHSAGRSVSKVFLPEKALHLQVTGTVSGGEALMSGEFATRQTVGRQVDLHLRFEGPLNFAHRQAVLLLQGISGWRFYGQKQPANSEAPMLQAGECAQPDDDSVPWVFREEATARTFITLGSPDCPVDLRLIPASSGNHTLKVILFYRFTAAGGGSWDPMVITHPYRIVAKPYPRVLLAWHVRIRSCSLASLCFPR